MSSFNQGKVSKYLIFGLAFALAAAFRIWVIGQPIETVLSEYGSDDLFYFTEIARNWVLLGDPTFDTIHKTTGFQVLFTLFLLPLHNFLDTPEMALKTVFVLATIFSLLTAVLIPRLIRVLFSSLDQSTNYWLGITAMVFFLLNPRVIEVTFQGTEASLAFLCWTISLICWSRASQSFGFSLLFGFTLSLGFLARVDHVFLAAFLLLLPYKKGSKVLLHFWVPGLVLGTMFLAWAYFNYTVTGDFMPDSGTAKRLGTEHYLAANDIKGFDALVYGFTNLKNTMMNLLRVGSSISYLEIGLVVFFVITSFRKRHMSVPKPMIRRSFIVPFLSTLSIVLFYAIFLKSLRSWYLVPLILFELLFFSYIITLLIKAIQGRVGIWQPIVSFFFAFVLLVQSLIFPTYGWGDHYLEAAMKFEKEMPENSVIGAFNAGIYGAALHQRHTLINLDGVVNHSATLAKVDNRFDEYMDSLRLNYLLDHRSTIMYNLENHAPAYLNKILIVDTVKIPERPDADIYLYKIDRK